MTPSSKHAFLVVVFHALSIHALELTPPSNQWVRPGQNNVTLVCKTTEKVRSCSWTTPYGKSYPLEAGLVAEAGRLAHYVEGEQKDFECGVLITQFETRDSGRWKCNVGVVENSEVTTATGLANISVATAPKAVMLDQPFNNEHANVSKGKTYEVKCIATEARPAPKFLWKLDDELLEGKTMDEEVFVDPTGISTFAQTLYYKPEYHQDNKTLRCVINHVALTEDDSIGVVILLDEAPIVEPQTMALGAGGTAGIVIAVVIILVVIVILLIIVARSKKSNQQKKIEEQLDEEKAIGEEDDGDKTSQTESAHCDTEEGEEAGQKNLMARVTDFVVDKLKKPTEKKPAEKKEVEEVVTETEKKEEKMEEMEPEDKEEKKE